MMQTNEGTKNLVYADIGPSSLKNPTSSFSTAIELDDHHVDYAELNLNFHSEMLLKSSDIVVHTIGQSQTNFDGIIIFS